MKRCNYLYYKSGLNYNRCEITEEVIIYSMI